MKKARMKKQTMVLLAMCLFVFMCNVQAQNMYLMKNGAVIQKHSIQLADLDSVVYYEPAHAISTTAVSSIDVTVATSGGTITAYDGAIVTARGVCWSTSHTPTIALSTKTSNGTGTGAFSSNLTGLTLNTTYYLRAYATNNSGLTSYGAEVSFTTLAVTAGVTDVDGNFYHTVTIGTQTWMVENLKTTKYRNGDPILSPAGSWSAVVTGAQAAYNNDAANATKYGLLYNWYAAADSRKIAPVGWHVPTDTEWSTLTTYLGGPGVAGDKLKESGNVNWLSPSAGTNSTGFTALPGGYRLSDGTFSSLGTNGYWWTSTVYGSYAWFGALYYNFSTASKSNDAKQLGYSVRCLKD